MFQKFMLFYLPPKVNIFRSEENKNSPNILTWLRRYSFHIFHFVLTITIITFIIKVYYKELNIVSIKLSKYESDLGELKEFVQQLHPTDIIQNSKLYRFYSLVIYRRGNMFKHSSTSSTSMNTF